MSTQTIDPREGGHKPAPDEPNIEHHGLESEMRTKPDHGEESYRGFNRLEGKVAIITGGDSGIGRAIAIAFSREGADVAIAYLPEEEDDANQTERLVTDAGRRCLKFPGDIGDEAHCHKIVTDVLNQFGRL